MKPQLNMTTKLIKKNKAITVVMPFLYSLLILLSPMQLQAASISEELLKTELTNITQSNAQYHEQQSVKLTVSPKQCVAMQQGQRCYLQVNVAFQANAVNDYCLYLSSEQTALQCWQKSKTGKLSYAFDSNVDMEFVVKTSVTEQTKTRTKPLARAKVKVAWVHEKKGKPRMSWRLF